MEMRSVAQWASRALRGGLNRVSSRVFASWASLRAVSSGLEFAMLFELHQADYVSAVGVNGVHPDVVEAVF